MDKSLHFFIEGGGKRFETAEATVVESVRRRLLFRGSHHWFLWQSCTPGEWRLETEPWNHTSCNSFYFLFDLNITLVKYYFFFQFVNKLL